MSTQAHSDYPPRRRGSPSGPHRRRVFRGPTQAHPWPTAGAHAGAPSTQELLSTAAWLSTHAGEESQTKSKSVVVYGYNYQKPEVTNWRSSRLEKSGCGQAPLTLPMDEQIYHPLRSVYICSSTSSRNNFARTFKS